MRRFLICLSCLLALPLQSAMLADDIRNHYLPEEYQTILVGDEDMPVFSGEPTTSLSRGVALIFTDTGYQGLTLNNARALAIKLNHRGWHTLVVPAATLGVDVSTSVSQAAEPSQPDENNEDAPAIIEASGATSMHPRAIAREAMIDPASNRSVVALLANAVFQHTESIPGFRLVISQGMSAAQLIALTSADILPSPDGMVVISPYWPQSEANGAIPAQLAATEFPILDLQFPINTQWTVNSAAKQKLAATQALKLHYRNKALTPPLFQATNSSDTIFSRTLSKEIYGWVNHLGW